MFLVYDVTLIYENGTSITIDNLVQFDIELGDTSKVKWKQLPWAKTSPMILSVSRVMAAYKHTRRLWNPFKIHIAWKMMKE